MNSISLYLCYRTCTCLPTPLGVLMNYPYSRLSFHPHLGLSRNCCIPTMYDLYRSLLKHRILTCNMKTLTHGIFELPCLYIITESK
jgi:hypothetical protein